MSWWIFETLGTSPGSVIMSLGAVAFGRAGVTGRFYQTISIQSCLKAGLLVDGGALKFWLTETEEHVRTALFQGSLGLRDALHSFNGFWNEQGGKWLWAHGASFDIPMLNVAYRAAGYGDFVPWKFRDERDTRTFYSLLPAGRVNVIRRTPAHHALYDATFQAECVIKAYSDLGLQLPEV